MHGKTSDDDKIDFIAIFGRRNNVVLIQRML